MVTRPVRPTTQIQTVVGLDPVVTDALRQHLAEIADSAVLSIVEEVPSYAGAWSGRMGEVIRNAVQLALGGFLTLATRLDAEAPKAPAIEGAYQLGRGEARQGRTVEALLAAYRIGARSSWQDGWTEAQTGRTAREGSFVNSGPRRQGPRTRRLLPAPREGSNPEGRDAEGGSVAAPSAGMPSPTAPPARARPASCCDPDLLSLSD